MSDNKKSRGIDRWARNHTKEAPGITVEMLNEQARLIRESGSPPDCMFVGPRFKVWYKGKIVEIGDLFTEVNEFRVIGIKEGQPVLKDFEE